ncbi:AAA family ATPase [Streptomyces sp. NPDC006261]|uniref:AAA family ATPase n=1 Tax=Streptomyces sp. NPDC006261 TaxID=3156739 RepID=UPI0033B8F809
MEELENGLHPSQASQVLRLVREAATESATRVLITTHSPALLSALSGDDHQGVIVCSRDRARRPGRSARPNGTRPISRPSWTAAAREAA